MEDMSHRFQRLLGLLEEIRTRPGQSAQQLADRFGTSKRNLFRDIKLLQDSGFSVASDGGYKMTGDGESPAGGAVSVEVPDQGLSPWESGGSRPVDILIRVEPRLRDALRHQPLHGSQKLDDKHLRLNVSGVDRVVDWLMAVEGAELLEPSWLRGTLQRRARQLQELYSR